jgi:phosphoserine aminotransferase
VAALAQAGTTLLGTSHRQAPVRNLVQSIRRGLSDLFQIPPGYEVVLGNGGATAFWDIATLCLIESRSQHLVFGEFSAKFAQAASEAPYLGSPEIIEAPAGSAPSPAVSLEVDSYCLTQNETSTGVSMPVQRLGSAGQLVLVDATSAAGGMPIDISQTDAYYFSPQKCFASDGGLWLAVLSPAAIARTEQVVGSGRWVPASLNLLSAILNSRREQTYNTPSLATLFLLSQQLQFLLAEGGLEWSANRCRESAAVIYGWAESSDFATPFVSDSSLRSPVVATVDLDPTVSAETVSAVLRRNGVVDIDGYRKLGRNQIRVGLFPAIEPEDVQHLTRCIDWVVTHLDTADG